MLQVASLPRTPLESAVQARALFAALGGEPVEVVVLAYLDRDLKLLGLRHHRSGGAGAIDLCFRHVVGDAIAFDAAAVVMGHNHPSGDPRPSEADRRLTRRLVMALEAVDVRLIDHLVIARGGSLSFREAGWL